MNLPDQPYLVTQAYFYAQEHHQHHLGVPTVHNDIHASAAHVQRDSQSTEQAIGHALNTPVKAQRTPPKIEEALRRYNREGVTNWDEILNRLEKEIPSIRIKRSTLGEYLKECNIGGSRRKNMDEDEMRQRVLDELNQSHGRGRGVRKVWETLKSKGHHIKRDFVQKVMKEVDPNGFVARRPKWKSLHAVESANAAILAPSPPLVPFAASPSSQQPSQNAFPSLPMSISTGVAQAPMQVQPLLASSDYSHASTESFPQLGFQMVPREPATDNSSSLRFSVQDAQGGFGGGRMEWHTDNDHDTIQSETFRAPRGSGVTDVNRRTADEVAAAEALMDFPQDVPRVRDQGEEPGQSSRSEEVDMTGIARSSSSIEESRQSGLDGNRIVSSTPEVSPAEGTGSDAPAGGPDQTFWKAASVRLKAAINDLLSGLDEWCAAPLADMNSGPCSTGHLATSATQGTSINGVHQGNHSGNLIRRGYIPDYEIPEEEVTTKALLLTLDLRRTLSRHKSDANIVAVVGQLKEVWGMLEDIGTPRELLEKICLRRLDVATVMSQACGDEEWVLYELWQSATECVENFPWDFVHVEEAMNAAQRLSSISSTHSEFYHAAGLHYEAISLLVVDDEDEEGKEKLKSSVDLLGRVSPSKSSYEHVHEMMRAVKTYTIRADSEDDAKEVTVVFDKLLEHARTTIMDPALAILLATIAKGVLDAFLEPNHFSPIRKSVLSLVTRAIELLRSFQGARPSRVGPALACALETRAKILGQNGGDSEAKQDWKEILEIRRRLSKFGEQGPVEDYRRSIGSCVVEQLRSKRWEDAMDTTKRLEELIRSPSGQHHGLNLSDVLCEFRYHLESTRDPQALPVVRQLIDILRPVIGSHHFLGLLDRLTEVMLTVSGMQRECGQFEAALETSCEALAVARELGGRGKMDNEIYIKVLAYHALSLVDNDAYEDAIAYLEEARQLGLSFKERDPAGWADQLGFFGVVHAYPLGTTGSGSCLDHVIALFRRVPRVDITPSWLALPRYYSERIDARAWLLLIQTAMRWRTSPADALISAKESLALMSECYDKHFVVMEPYTRGSVLGHKYILMSILGEREQRRSILHETITLYRSVFNDKPHMARLPLLVFLEILLIFSDNITTLRFATSTPKTWKKGVYRGSISFFEDFVAFLEGLPHYICADAWLLYPDRASGVSRGTI